MGLLLGLLLGGLLGGYRFTPVDLDWSEQQALFVLLK